MIKYVIKRILLMIPIVIGVVWLVFTILWFTPGDPAEIAAGAGASEEDIEATRIAMGIDKPYIVQLGNYLYKLIFHFDLGNCLATGVSVGYEISTRIGNSLIFAVFGILISIVIGIPLGIYAALHQNKPGDYLATVIALLGSSTPGFWLALMLVLLFSYKLGWLPAYGMKDGVKSWILPIMANCFHGIANMCRQTRSGMLDVLNSDYVLMAKSKGLPWRKVVFKHALPNALIPIITLAGMNFGTMLGGGIIIEKVFSIPGIGNFLTTCVSQRDHIGVMGGVVVTSMFFCVVMLLSDIALAMVDPRIKARYVTGKRRK
ncbi:MAG: ABC transporter permease [Oscillospiraceae bacterium]